MKRSILLSAYGCEPGKGSEQGVGWNWTLQLARSAELVVITRSNNREAIEAALPQKIRDSVFFEYYDLPSFITRFKKKEKGLYLYYLLWQWGAFLHARKLVKKKHFDYVIALTFGSIWMPTFMHLLNVPFIWGPIGGGEAVPFNLISNLPLRPRIPQLLRYVLIALVRINPFVMGPIRRARVVLARTQDTARLIPAAYSDKVKVVLETAIPDNLLIPSASLQTSRNDTSLRVMYSGRLVALKNVSTAIHAIALAKRAGVRVRFVIIGDGQERKALQSLACQLEVVDDVEFCGAIPHNKVIEELQKSDVYLFPSLKEGGVWSLMEAMSVGLPVVCINASGMSIITDESSAIRVDPLSQEHIIAGFAEALIKLANSPEQRHLLGKNARVRMQQHFHWDHKGDFMRDLFESLESTSA